MHTRQSAGFTLIEVIVVVALVAILSTVAVPLLLSMVRNNRAAAQTNEFVGALLIARSEAIKRGTSVTVCARSADDSACASQPGDWRRGCLVFADAAGDGAVPAADQDILQVFAPLSAASELEAQQDNKTVTFGPSGFLDPSGHSREVAFLLSVAGCRGDENRKISINLQGRASTTRKPCY